MNGDMCRSDETFIGTCVSALIAFRIQMPQPSGRSRSRPYRAPAAAHVSVPAGMASGMSA